VNLDRKELRDPALATIRTMAGYTSEKECCSECRFVGADETPGGSVSALPLRCTLNAAFWFRVTPTGSCDYFENLEDDDDDDDGSTG
jgi:hypothetical protein